MFIVNQAYFAPDLGEQSDTVILQTQITGGFP